MYKKGLVINFVGLWLDDKGTYIETASQKKNLKIVSSLILQKKTNIEQIKANSTKPNSKPK